MPQKQSDLFCFSVTSFCNIYLHLQTAFSWFGLASVYQEDVHACKPPEFNRCAHLHRPAVLLY